MKKKSVLLTGATGVMGLESLKRMMPLRDNINIRLLIRPSRKNKRILKPFLDQGIEVVWGDLRDYNAVKRSIADIDLVLHVGGMVSPKADKVPALTMDTNINAAKNIVKAIDELNQNDITRVVYIGSVAEYGHRDAPHHWGRCGDPLEISRFDHYALSKVIAERIIVDSKIKHWAVLRQTGILYPALLFNGSDPISFHVPLKGVLEWATVEDSGQLMANIAAGMAPDEFWNKFYNISSGPEFRLTNYDFERHLMECIGCPPPEKAFKANWFATRNFHGMWYTDADRLEEMLHFREGISCNDYFKRLSSQVPAYFKLARFVPPVLIRLVMKQVAKKKDFGTLSWLATDNKDKIKAYFGSRQDWNSIGDWDNIDLSAPSDQPILTDYGFNLSTPEDKIDIDILRAVAKYRNGELCSTSMTKGNIDELLTWKCNKCGCEFQASPRLVLYGGHWCPSCLEARLKP